MRLEHKVAVITGGGTGLGRGIALAMAREGARLALWELDQQAALSTASEIEALGRPALVSVVDVSAADQVAAAGREVLERWGRVDILVNNAGICQTATVEEISEQDWDRVLAVNLKGTFLCCKALMPAMKKQGDGCIINLGSVAGKIGGIATGAHYAASKAAVMCFTKSLARELAPYGVNVNALAPGVIETEMTRRLSGGDWSTYLAGIPLGRIGRVEDLAGVAVFLASEEAAYLTGEIIDVNGGLLMD